MSSLEIYKINGDYTRMLTARRQKVKSKKVTEYFNSALFEFPSVTHYFLYHAKETQEE